jgi:hypothetical protein
MGDLVICLYSPNLCFKFLAKYANIHMIVYIMKLHGRCIGLLTSITSKKV